MLKLAVFDLDGTLKQVRDPYAYLHQHLGVPDHPALIAAGVSGAIPYVEWLRRDVAGWVGVSRRRLEALLRADPYVSGARETAAALRARGVTVAIISTGLLLHAELVAEELGIGPVFGNEIGFEDRGAGPVVSGVVRAHVPVYGKGAVLERLQAMLGISPAECIAAGDTSGDLALFERAAVGIAVHPHQPEVAAAADIVLPELDLRPLLPRLQEVAPQLWP